MKKHLSRDPNTWTLVAAGAGALAAIATHQALGRAWKAVRKTPPPEDPTRADVTWTDALLWAGATGLAMGIGRVVARRAAVAGWKKATGRMPPA